MALFWNALLLIRTLFDQITHHFVHNVTYLGKIVFNTAWEDPELDLKALNLSKDDQIVMITSAGCNALAYAIRGPKHIYSIDRNPCQNAILELKIAAIKEFDYDTFWKMWGEGKLPNFTTQYYPRLRKYLSPSAAAFWDSKSYYFDGKRLRNSFYYHGCSGFLGWMVIRVYCKMLPGLLQAVQSLWTAENSKEQRNIYEHKIKPKFWNAVTLNLLASSMSLTFMTGVPKPQQKLLEEEGGVVDFVKKQFEWICTDSCIKRNYFYKVYVNGQYTKGNF